MINGKNSDLWNFTKEHQEVEIKAWGGYIGKNDGFEPFGWTCEHDGSIYYFNLDDVLLKTKAL